MGLNPKDWAEIGAALAGARRKGGGGGSGGIAANRAETPRAETLRLLGVCRL